MASKQHFVIAVLIAVASGDTHQEAACPDPSTATSGDDEPMSTLQLMKMEQEPCIPSPGPNNVTWISDIASKSGTYHLCAGSFSIDKQYLLQAGTQIIGKGSGVGADSTIIEANHSQDGGVCNNNITKRVGFVLGNNTYIARLHYKGMDTLRPQDNGFLCGGAPFETPGCADPYCGGQCPVNKNLFVPCTVLGYSEPLAGLQTGNGDGYGSMNVLVEDVSVERVQIGFFMPPNKKTVSACHNVTVRNLVATSPLADGINIHGQHSDILVDGCSISQPGDDAYAAWSFGDGLHDVTFKNSFAEAPKGPANTGRNFQNCGAMYGGTAVTFQNLTCKDIDSPGFIKFDTFPGRDQVTGDQAFFILTPEAGLFPPNAKATVAGVTGNLVGTQPNNVPCWGPGFMDGKVETTCSSN